MNRKIQIRGHLSQEAIELRYHKAKDIVEKSHWQIIRLFMRGKSTLQIAEIVGYSPNWVRMVVRRYNQEGPAALEDHRHCNPGAQFVLSEAQQLQLQYMLNTPPPEGGTWNGPKVAAWIQKQTGRVAHSQLGWEYLKRLKRNRRIIPIYIGDLKRDQGFAADDVYEA